MKKRIFSLVLVISIVASMLTALPITVNAATEDIYTYSVSGNKATITKCATSASGNIEIPSTLGGYTVVAIGSDAFKNCDSLTSIEIPNGVTSIGSGAFSECGSLTSVTIPKGVTVIGEGAFKNSSVLVDVNLPKGILVIDEDTFYGCSSLKDIIIPDSVMFINDSAFYNCDSLTSISIPSGVASIGYEAFYDCDSLASIELLEGEKSIDDYAFGSCDSLTSITIPDGVTKIDNSAFYNCDSLSTVNISETVTNIGTQAFGDCNSLININVDEDNPYYVSIDGNLFNKDKTTILQYAIGKSENTYKIPDSVTTIGKDAFYNADSLVKITLHSGITLVDWYAFCNCDNLMYITVFNSLKSIYSYAFGSCSKLKDVFYIGTSSEWSKVDIDKSTYSTNRFLLDAKKHYMTTSVVKTPATHFAEGVITYTCPSCGVSVTESVRKLPEHEYGEWETDEENHKRDCACGYSEEGAHTWGKGVVTLEPTYSKEGIKTYTCTECNYEKTESIEMLPTTDDATTITIGDAKTRAGKEITVPVSISNNSGIVGLQLSCEYDSDIFTLTGIEKGDALSGLELTSTTDLGKKPVILLWDGMEEDDSNGDIALLKFAVADNATVGMHKITVDVKIICDSDMNDIPARVNDGTVEIIEFTLGDPNDDGKSDVKDIIAVRRYIADGYGVTIIEKAADINKDNSVDVKDIVMLRRYIAGGYGIEL